MDAQAQWFADRLANDDPLLREVRQGYCDGMDPTRDVFYFVPAAVPNADRRRQALDYVAEHDIDPAALQAQLNEARDRLANAERELGEVTRDRSNVQRELADAQRQIADLTRERDELKDRVSECREMIHLIRGAAPVVAPVAAPAPIPVPAPVLDSWQQHISAAAQEFWFRRLTDSDEIRLGRVTMHMRTADTARRYFLSKRLWLDSGKADHQDAYEAMADQVLGGTKNLDDARRETQARRHLNPVPPAAAPAAPPPAPARLLAAAAAPPPAAAARPRVLPIPVRAAAPAAVRRSRGEVANELAGLLGIAPHAMLNEAIIDRAMAAPELASFVDAELQAAKTRVASKVATLDAARAADPAWIDRTSRLWLGAPIQDDSELEGFLQWRLSGG